MIFIEKIIAQLENNKGQAFCIKDKYYSYSELNSIVSRIVFKINSDPNVLKSKKVGVLCTNDINTYASILACWICGYSYIPLGLNNPDNRNLTILKDAEVKIVLSTKELNLETYCNYRIINTLKIENTITKITTIRKILADDLAYILFTSGSTGNPKGVPITFKNINSFLTNFDKSPVKIKIDDKCLQMFELTFDVSISSFLPALIVGATIYTVRDSGIRYMNVLKVLNDYNLDVIQIVPSVLRLGNSLLGKLNFQSVKYCILTGEATSLNVANDAEMLMPNAEIYNYYGPTEATIYCSYFKYDKKNLKSYNGMLAIGNVFNGINFMIVNPDTLDSLNDLEKGELLVEGDQITSGYLNNPEKNKEMFVNINKEGKLSRYYRTGDMAYRDEKGDYFYCGRFDSQVKIQGFRVELSEIEFKVFNNFKINCIALTLFNKTNSSEIILILEFKNSKHNEKILKSLKEELPAYMVPKKILNIQELPLNSSGKIDRAELKLIVNEHFK